MVSETDGRLVHCDGLIVLENAPDWSSWVAHVFVHGNHNLALQR